MDEKVKIVNLSFNNKKLTPKVIQFLFLYSEFVAFRRFTPVSIMLVPRRNYQFFFENFFYFIFENFNFQEFEKTEFVLNFSWFSKKEYEELIIQISEDLELDDFIVTPREGKYNKIPIYIRSINFAQGTGAHPTTRLILNNLKEILPYQEEKTLVIDYGSGSGILSIAVKKILPQSIILPIEINFKSIKESLSNFKLNSLNLIAFLSDRPYIINLTKVKKRFNKTIFIANVPLQVIQMCMNHFYENDFLFDHLIISGIKKPSNQNNQEFIEKLENENLKKYLKNYSLKTDSMENWILILGTKK